MTAVERNKKKQKRLECKKKKNWKKKKKTHQWEFWDKDNAHMRRRWTCTLVKEWEKSGGIRTADDPKHTSSPVKHGGVGVYSNCQR